jgi:hypothetical protein
MPPTIRRCRRNVFTEMLPSNDKGIHRETHRYTRPSVPLLLPVFVAAGTCLPRHCLATKGVHFTEPLFSSGRRDTPTDRLMGGIYELRR